MNTAEKEFELLVNDEWENHLEEYPLYATSSGDHRYDDKLDGMFESDFERRLRKQREFKDRLNTINFPDLSGKDKINYDIFNQMISNRIKYLEFKAYRMALSKMDGFHLELPELYLNVPFNDLQDYTNYLSRLEAISEHVDGYIDIMTKGLQEGQVQPRIAMAGVTDALKNHLVTDPAKSQFYIPFTQFSKKISSLEQLDLINRAKKIIIDGIVPSFRKFVDFLESEYIPHIRVDISASNLPDGKSFYDFCIVYQTTLHLKPEEIHQIGLDEVKRIRSEMEDVVKKTNFKGSIKEFVEFLRTDSQFYVSSPQELLEKTSLVLKRMDGELPTLFKTLPRLPYGIRAIPDYAAPGNTTAYYHPGTGDGTKSGTYYVNTYDLKSRPLYEIEALSLHEAVPGHHLQLALQIELDMPKFRKFTHFTSFVEGWGLYAERLGLETGFYTDPYSNFGRLSYEMWRACRLVVDTGMHALQWSRQQAIDFMAEYTSLSLLNVVNEIDRYISWPGQALAYKLGELKIRELRTKAEKELGNKFDKRLFHDAVLLNGSIPLNILEKNILNFIQANK